MQLFENETISGAEKAIKIGTRVVSGDVNLAWFTSEEIKPSNSISIVDSSSAIAENFITDVSSNEPHMAYADELGFLRTVDGKYNLPTNNLTISNLFLSKPTFTERVSIANIDAKDYVHYMYVSRFFLPSQAGLNIISRRQFVEYDKLKSLAIKVIDSSNKEYIDPSNNKRKYRILLEPFKTDSNINNTELPYRIIVLLDHDQPSGLKLVYDKVECDEDGNMFNLETQYTESINAVQYFEEVPEESFVIDENYYDKEHFSIKKSEQKYSDVFSTNINHSGYQVIAPTKAINDYRVFEVFNWRLIARSSVNINFDQINYGQELDAAGNVIQRTVKVGVLYSSAMGQIQNSVINPYIFLRLQNSPFNLSKYSFINPLQQNTINTNEANYWKVDIDNIDDLSQFDILAWSPTFSITANHKSKLDSFIRANGTLILDMSSTSADATIINPQLAVDYNLIPSAYIDMIEDSVVVDYRKNGGWTLVDQIFEKPYYGIYGANYISRTNTYKTYPYFKSSATEKTFLKCGQSSSTAKPIGIVIDYPSVGDAVTKGNIMSCTFPLMAYCNSIYSSASPEQVSNSNYADISAEPASTTIYSGIQEGPFKLLYNTISYALYSKALASRSIDLRSSLYNYVSPWKSSWAMNSSALLDDEKSEYFTKVSINTSTDIYTRDLTSNDSSLFDYYKKSLAALLPDAQRDILSNISYENTDFYLEITNPDIKVVNATVVDEDDFSVNENIPSSYTLHKVSFPNSKAFAYTDKWSPKLEPPDKIGTYAIVDRALASSSTRELSNNLNVLASFKSYPFNLQSSYNYAVAKDKPLILNANIKSNLTLTQNVSLSYTVRTIVKPYIPSTPDTQVTVIPSCVNFKSSIDDLNQLRTTNISADSNIFPYTGDIDIHLQTKIWTNGAPYHEYVKYIQYTLAIDKHYSGPIDGKYGSSTETAVRSFQKKYKQRWEDGKVDSETKWYLALYWLALKAFNPTLFNDTKAFASPDIRKYIEAAENTALAKDIGKKTFRKITFSGITGPSQGADVIWFEMPASIQDVNKIIIEPDDNAIWRQWKIDSYGYSASATTNIFATTLKTDNKSAASGNIEINFGPSGVPANTIKYFWIRIVGGPLAYYGLAEGFGIKSIKAQGITTQSGTPGQEEEVDEDVETVTVPVTLNVVSTETASNISSANNYIKTYQTNNIPRSTSYVSSISWVNPENRTTITKTFTANQYKLNDTNVYTFDNLNINFSDAPSSITRNSTTVESVTSQGATVDTSSLTLIQSGNTITIETSSVYYSGSQVFNITNSLNSYRLKRLNGSILPDSRNAINVNDGILLMCKADGSPYGLVSSSEINTQLSGITSITDEEIDLRYGFFYLKNLVAEDNGFIYGFYDLNEKEFIGKTISYIDYINRGISNIYVGICAIDADGNTQNKNEYIGPSVDITFRPVNIPLKSIVPIYSIKYNNNSSIKVGSIDGNINRFECWELPVTTGSFWKEISIPSSRQWSDWKANYSGQTIAAYYSTQVNLPVIWSDIYGYGHYDILDEQPVLLTEKKIQVRRNPILSWNYPTDYFNSKFGIVKSVIQIYIRDSINSDWVEVPYSSIRDINCDTGVVEFKNRIVPSDNRLIKVSYTTKNKNILLKQVNGDPIPINPVLNKDVIQFNRPLYIYIYPAKMYKKNNSQTTELSQVTDHRYYFPVNFTYDSSLFNISSINYDPFALPIAVIYVYNNPYKSQPTLVDLRLRGGGVQNDIDIFKLKQINSDVISFWDVYPPEGTAYNKGGYVIIQIPEEVKDNFVDKKEIHEIISNNLTAGVVYELQDMNGNSWD